MSNQGVAGLMSANALPLPGQTSSIASAFRELNNNALLDASIAAEDDVYEEEEETPKKDVTDLFLPSATTVPTPTASVHSRPKLGKKASEEQIKRGLVENGLNIDDHMVSSLSNQVKSATLTPGEIEVMAATIRACQQDYALNELKSAITDITSRVKSLTAELDDAGRKTKTVTQSLAQNLESSNKLKEALSTPAATIIPSPAIVQPVSFRDRAIQMVEDLVDMQNAQTAEFLPKFELYIQKHMPQMSSDSFRRMPKDERVKIMTLAYNM